MARRERLGLSQHIGGVAVFGVTLGVEWLLMAESGHSHNVYKGESADSPYFNVIFEGATRSFCERPGPINLGASDQKLKTRIVLARD